MTIAAVSLKTESADSYLFLYKDIQNPEDFIQRVHEELGDELGCVYDYTVVTDDATEKELEKALADKISELDD